jgi:hypothetical protein
VQHADRDPQVELVRRYARILRSAPAEAMRVQGRPDPQRAAELIEPSRFGRRAGAKRRSPARPEQSTPLTEI